MTLLFVVLLGKKEFLIKKERVIYVHPKVFLKLETVYYRKIELKKLNKIKIKRNKKNMGWCNDPLNKKYNSLIKINEKLNMKNCTEKIINMMLLFSN